MHRVSSIVIRAPLGEIFETTADLLSWPRWLPHYRSIRVLARDGDGLIVRMAARRGRLPIRWTSRYVADARVLELRFHHLKAFTKGMDVTWTFTSTPDGVLVRISHELARGGPLARWFAERIIADGFITPVASQTLAHFKRHLERGRR